MARDTQGSAMDNGSTRCRDSVDFADNEWWQSSVVNESCKWEQVCFFSKERWNKGLVYWGWKTTE
jgi:hypothetical protein